MVEIFLIVVLQLSFYIGQNNIFDLQYLEYIVIYKLNNISPLVSTKGYIYNDIFDYKKRNNIKYYQNVLDKIVFYKISNKAYFYYNALLNAVKYHLAPFSPIVATTLICRPWLHYLHSGAFYRHFRILHYPNYNCIFLYSNFRNKKRIFRLYFLL